MELAGGLERLSPVEIDGVRYAVWLLDIRADPRSHGSVLEVKVAARNPAGRHYIGRFHVSADRLHDEGVARAIETIELVVRRNLPPAAPGIPF